MAHIESLLNKATSFTENPIAAPLQSGPVTLPDENEKDEQEHDEIEDRREAARQLAVQVEFRSCSREWQCAVGSSLDASITIVEYAVAR